MKRYRLFTLIIAVLLTSFIMTSCSKPVTKEDIKIDKCFDTRMNCQIYVPLSTEDKKYPCDINIPFSRFYTGEGDYLDILNDNTLLTVGEDVILKGENIALLDGAEFHIYCDKTATWFEEKKEEFAELLSEEYIKAYESEAEPGADFDSELKAASKLINEYYESGYVCEMSIAFQGEITSDITIEGMSVPELGFERDFEKVSIKTFTVPEDVIWEKSLGEDEGPIAHKEWSIGEENPWISYDAFPVQMGKAFIDGRAREYINSIGISPLSDGCIIINEANYQNYLNLPNVNESVYVYSEQKEENFAVADEILLRYNYVYDKETMRDFDCIISTLLVKTETGKGEQIWKTGDVGCGEEGIYLILPMIREELQNQ